MDKTKIISEKARLGDALKRLREGNGVTKYAVMKHAGFSSYNPIDAIEKGASAYTVDNLLIYLDAINHEINFAERR